MLANNDAIDVKVFGAQGITVNSSQTLVRPPLAVSSILVKTEFYSERLLTYCVFLKTE